MATISAVIITLNEEQNLEKCLKSLKSWVDEIVVVDSGSTDSTLEIAKKYQAKIFTRDFDTYESQKNFAASKAISDWIFSIDADEIVPSTLADEITNAIKSEEYAGYSLPRRNFILGQEIKHSWWSPDRHIWVWKKGQGKWKGDVHEEVVVDGKVGELQNAKLHYTYKTTQEFMAANDKYSTLMATHLHKQKIHFSWIKLMVNPLKEFLIRFGYKLGFLDGWRGFVLALLMSRYQFQVWWKLRNLQ
jgi:glycosyltransferase involved in cell wall biosynthesis